MQDEETALDQPAAGAAPPSGASKLSRRQVLGGAAALGVVAVGAGTIGWRQRSKRDGGSLRVANWPLYIDDATVSDFSRATGIDVEYDDEAIEDNDTFLASVIEGLEANRDIGWDVVVLTDWMSAKWVFNRWALRLDIGEIPNRVNVRSELASPSYDPSRLYTLPWMSGMTGIAYDSDVIRDLRSLSQLFDPRYKGKVGILSEMRDTLGLMLSNLGYAPEGFTIGQAKLAIEKLARARADYSLRIYGAEYTDALLSGEVVASIGWAGDIQALQAKRPSLRWIIPDEGGMIYTDNMMIPKTSPNAAAAYQWINYVYEARRSAQIVRQIPYISPVNGALEEVLRTSPASANSVAINPTAEDRRRLHAFRTMSDSMTDEISKLFENSIR